MKSRNKNACVLHVTVGETLGEAGACAAAAMKAIERGEDGRVHVPWSEIVVDMKLPNQIAA